MRCLGIGLSLGLAVLSAVAIAADTPPRVVRFFEDTQHNFGRVPRGAQLLHRFTWTNPLGHRIEMVDTRVSCGCATVYVVPRGLEPGQTGTIEVAVDTRRFIGSKTVYIQLLAQPGPVAGTLQVTADSRGDLVYNPGDLNFGIVKEGEHPERSLQIEYAGALDFQIEGPGEVPPGLAVTVKETYRRAGQAGYEVKAKLTDSATSGDFRHTVLLKTNDPQNPAIPVLAMGSIRSDVTLTPNPVHFGSIAVGRMAQRRFTIRSNEPFRIKGIHHVPEGMTPLYAETAANVHTVLLQWQPKEAGEANFPLEIQTDLEKHSKLQVTVTAHINP
jgi:hypothetical protein